MADATGGEILLDARLYHASAAEIIAVLPGVIKGTARRDVDTVMIVGHNPGLEQLIAQLTGEWEALPTAALAQIALPIERWPDLDTETRGTLVGSWRPKDWRTS